MGFCHLQVELTTRQLRYMSSLDEERLRSAAVRAAEAIMHGDEETARECIQRAFDTLTEAREYFYPVEAKLLDLTLVASTTLGEPLRRRIGRAGAVEPVDLRRHGGRDGPARAGDARGASGRVGRPARRRSSAASSAKRPCRCWRRNRSSPTCDADLAAYEEHLGHRPKIFARRRFGLSPILPGILKKLGFQGACHFTLDAGRFPTGNQSKIRWEGLDAASLESLARVPLDASRDDTFLKLPERLGRVMDLDHTATAVFAHWPGKSSRWYGDLRRTARYSPVLGRFVTIDKYFEDTSGSGQIARHGPDDYRSPYLVEAVEAGQRDPISRWVRHHRRRVHLDVLGLARLSGGDARRPGRCVAGRGGNGVPGGPTPGRTGGTGAGRDRSRRRIAAGIDRAMRRIARALPRETKPPEAGHVLVNPLSFSTACYLDAAGRDRRGHGPSPGGSAGDGLRLGGARDPAARARGGDAEEVVLEPASAGASPRWPSGAKRACTCSATSSSRRRSTRRRGRSAGSTITALAVTGWPSRSPCGCPARGLLRTTLWDEEDEEQDYSVMAADEVRVDSPGPTLGRITSRGRLVDREGKRLAGFVADDNRPARQPRPGDRDRACARAAARGRPLELVLRLAIRVARFDRPSCIGAWA